MDFPELNDYVFDDEEEESAHTGIKVHKKPENSASDTVFRDC